MNWNDLRQIWSIREPSSIQPIVHGINNLTYLLEASTGSYILRMYPSDRLEERIRYELNLLNILQQKKLPFQIPAPISTVTGELFMVISETFFTLSPWLPGSPPQNDNLKQAHAAGQALAELVKALADIKVGTTPQVVPFPLSGDFAGWAGMKIDYEELIQGLPLNAEQQDQILTLLKRTQALAPSLYRPLPQQLIHRDYDQSNVLMEENSVTGVLDFEFCGPDLRILDLAYANSRWPSGLWNTGQEWPVIDAFGRGYLSRQQLPLAELEMLPDVLRLRATTSLFFRLGRYKRGLEASETLFGHIYETMENESWLKVHQEELLSHIRSWQD